MFTGIVETTSEILEKTDKSIKIFRPKIFSKLKIGQSIAVNGACLSVAEFSDNEILFHVMSETFRRTNLRESKIVNLERAMSATGRFEGHIVLGHIDSTLTLLHKKIEISGVEFVFQMPENSHQKKFLVEKGSICLNGVSLTIGKIKNTSKQESTFSVFLIPLTLRNTNLGVLKQGESVTVEYDYLAKFVINK